MYNTLKHINNKQSRLSLDKAPLYYPGNKMIVDWQNLTIKSENNQILSSKYISLFTVKWKVSSYTYEVETSNRIHLYKVIYTFLLKLF